MPDNITKELDKLVYETGGYPVGKKQLEKIVSEVKDKAVAEAYNKGCSDTLKEIVKSATGRS